MQSIDVPSFIQRPSGIFVLDVLPLLSLLPCCATLEIFRKAKRYGDLAVFGVGFALAFVYHLCQMHHGGLEATTIWGVSGSLWRSYDILSCLTLLTRTVGHIFAADCLPYSILPNVVFPSALLVFCFNVERVDMSMLVSVALGTMVMTALVSVLLRGADVLPSFRRGGSVLSCFVVAVVFLFLPNVLGNYWLFHSLWHAVLAAGYYQLYDDLEGHRLKSRVNGKAKRDD